MNSIHSQTTAGTGAAAQAQRGSVEPARHETRERFATTLRNNVHFAHAHAAHLQGQARSANARRLAKALAKKRQGKAAATRFAPTRRPTTTRTAGNARSAPIARSTDRQRNTPLRVTRDGGNGGSRGGGQQQGEPRQQEQRRRKDDAHDDDDFTLMGTEGASRATDAVPEFAAHAANLAGKPRREALAAAWCDRVLSDSTNPRDTRSLHDAMAQLRALRQREGALPLGLLAQVRHSLMDATARVAAMRQQRGETSAPRLNESAARSAPRLDTANATRNLLAPLLALVAGAPVSAPRENRARCVNAALDGTARAHFLRSEAASEHAPSGI
jgi:hypothetical protein